MVRETCQHVNIIIVLQHIFAIDTFRYSLTRNCGKRRESLPPPLPPTLLLLLVLSALCCSWFGLAECSLLLLFITVGFIVNFFYVLFVYGRETLYSFPFLFDLIDLVLLFLDSQKSMDRRPFANCYFTIIIFFVCFLSHRIDCCDSDSRYVCMALEQIYRYFGDAKFPAMKKRKTKTN